MKHDIDKLPIEICVEKVDHYYLGWLCTINIDNTWLTDWHDFHDAPSDTQIYLTLDQLKELLQKVESAISEINRLSIEHNKNNIQR